MHHAFSRSLFQIYLGTDMGRGAMVFNFFFSSKPETTLFFLSGKGTSKVFFHPYNPIFLPVFTFYFFTVCWTHFFSSLFAKQSCFFNNKRQHSPPPSTYHLVGPLSDLKFTYTWSLLCCIDFCVCPCRLHSGGVRRKLQMSGHVVTFSGLDTDRELYL